VQTEPCVCAVWAELLLEAKHLDKACQVHVVLLVACNALHNDGRVVVDADVGFQAHRAFVAIKQGARGVEAGDEDAENCGKAGGSRRHIGEIGHPGI